LAEGAKSATAHFKPEDEAALMVQLRQASNPSNRRVIVWLTDSYPIFFRRMSFPLHTEVEAIRAVHEDGVVVAPILLKGATGALTATFATASEASKREESPPGDAKKYAEISDGQALGMRGKQPEARLAQLIDELRARYTVGYRPLELQAPGTFRKIRVELAPDGALRPKEWAVLAREGHYRK
jgi:hypothetical protein